MDGDQPIEKQHQPSLIKEAVGEAVETARTTKQRTNHPRQLLSGSALGVCLVFIVGMMALPRLDEPLTLALYAFVIAMPLLVVDYYSASYKLDEGSDQGPRRLLLLLLFASGWAVGDVFGPIAVYAGVVAVVWHINRTAGIALLAWSGGVMIVVVFVMLIGLILYSWRKKRTQETPQ